MTRTDAELGTEKLCTRCGEWWPLDAEFWYRQVRRGRPYWYSICRGCWNERSNLRYAEFREQVTAAQRAAYARQTPAQRERQRERWRRANRNRNERRKVAA